MASDKRFVVCVDNADYRAALEIGKIYQVVSDPVAAARSYLRVVDEAGDDYLYPRKVFTGKVRAGGSRHAGQGSEILQAQELKELEDGQAVG